MHKEFRPISCELFPKKKEIINETNCLAFTLGICKPRRKSENYHLDKNMPIDIAFLKKVKELGFDTKKFKRIPTKDENKTKGYVIRVYSYSKVTLSDGTITEDFHVIRREPNGQWVHKPGFGYYSRYVSTEDWITILGIYGKEFISFAIEE